jgi:hypothetical protein
VNEEDSMRLVRHALLSVAITLLAGGALAADSTLFDSPTAGIQVKRPADWHFVTAEQHRENLKAIKLSDEEFRAAMQKYSTTPLVAMMKFEEPFDDVNPSFKVQIKPYGELKGKSPAELIGLFVPQFEKIFKDFSLVQPPMDVMVSGIKSGYMRMNYSLEIPDGRSFPTSSELWVVPHGEYFFLIGAGTRQDEKTGSREEIQRILKTVKIKR